MEPVEISSLIEAAFENATVKVVGDGAHFEALVIAGEFDGEAEASGRIELLETARVRATLDTRNLVLAEGSFFEGRCRTRPESELDTGA